jgi:diguanylate cyclase (GGDEF)-like protein/PAS domain S-box-containing protein
VNTGAIHQIGPDDAGLEGVSGPPSHPWLRLHRALMPDYNAKATAYWWLVVVLGVSALGRAALEVSAFPTGSVVQVAVGIATAMLAGLFPVRIPRSKNSFAAGEIFIFLLLLQNGSAAATLAAGGEAMVGAWRTSKRWTSRIASPAMAALSMAIAGSMFEALLHLLQKVGITNDGMVVVAAMLLSLVYFVVNTLLVTAVPRLKRNERMRVSDLLGMFGWVGIAFGGSAAVAALLYLTFRQSGIGVLMAVLPVLGMLMATLHYYFRQQEAQEEGRVAAAHAAQREALAAANHLQQLEASERRFHSAFTHAFIGMALLSVKGLILQANAAMHALLGAGDDVLREHRFQDFVVDADLPALNERLARVHESDSDGFAIELRCRHSRGGEVWVSAHCGFFSEPSSPAPCLILQVQDITARRKAEAGLHQLAFNDSLTGLPNRRQFREQLWLAVKRSNVDPAQRFAVLFLDFDRFKLINDSLGHSAGDEFLSLAAGRIQENLRPVDIVARLGGDEFAILMQRLDHEQDCILLAERLMRVLCDPFNVAGTELITSASIGITISDIGYTSPEDVLRDADIAMYKAKSAGKARYALFDVGLHSEVAQRLRLEGELRRVIATDQLAVAYQPLFELSTGAITGFEALARWARPDHGAVSPEEFIPIAEESGLIVSLTDLVLRRACTHLREWQMRDPAFSDITMHVNISAQDLGRAGFVTRVKSAIRDARLQPKHLTLELTENILMEHIETALPIIVELRSLGIGFSVDDFGTGYSSLSHLSNLPVDSLKVDRSFVRHLRPGTKEATVVRAIVFLGNSLGKTVIAEGIETPSQFAQLLEMGCETGQGFHLSRPLPCEGIERLLDRVLTQDGTGPSIPCSPMSLPAIGSHESPLDGPQRDCHPVGLHRLAEHVGHMLAYRCRADVQAPGDLPV